MLAGPDEVVFEEAGIKKLKDSALCLFTPYPPTPPLRTEMRDPLDLLLLPSQPKRRLKHTKNTRTETRALVLRGCDEGSWERMPDGNAGPLQQEGQ